MDNSHITQPCNAPAKTDKLAEELIDLKSRVESLSFTITDVKRRLVVIDHKEKCETYKRLGFRLAVLLGLSVVIIGLWWVYYITDRNLADISATLEAHTEKQLNSSQTSCTTIPYHN